MNHGPCWYQRPATMVWPRWLSTSKFISSHALRIQTLEIWRHNKFQVVIHQSWEKLLHHMQLAYRSKLFTSLPAFESIRNQKSYSLAGQHPNLPLPRHSWRPATSWSSSPGLSVWWSLLPPDGELGVGSVVATAPNGWRLTIVSDDFCAIKNWWRYAKISGSPMHWWLFFGWYMLNFDS